jgi:hypothetical protein
MTNPLGRRKSLGHARRSLVLARAEQSCGHAELRSLAPTLTVVVATRMPAMTYLQDSRLPAAGSSVHGNSQGGAGTYAKY